MTQENSSTNQITRSDVALGAPITGFITFALLTWSGTLPEDSEWKLYVTDASVSLIAALLTYFVTTLISYIRFLINLFTAKFSFWMKKRSYSVILNDTNMSDIAKKNAQSKLDALAETYTQQVEDVNI
ncbi:hypothetical protein [Aliivibrio fischeri]|uniref:hypothetical protein n=1 Tax=Aliivibrio fischeri TaxID=668 RepID=UPI001F26684A|nr:hypothetical protein [Aliivibrio fischeri]MCE4934009.1 hypothetical protein [Aliivibrio fischeri]